MSNPLILTVFLLSFSLVLAGCATPPRYIEATSPRQPLSTRFSHYDYEQAANAMVVSLKGNQNFLNNIAEFKQKNGNVRPKIVFDKIDSDVYSMSLSSNTGIIEDAIKTAVVNTGLFRVVGNENKMQARKFKEDNSVLTDPNKKTGFMGQSGADYIMSGKFYELRDEGGRTKERVYILEMQLDDLDSGEIVWADRKVIGKESKRAGFGF